MFFLHPVFVTTGRQDFREVRYWGNIIVIIIIIIITIIIVTRGGGGRHDYLRFAVEVKYVNSKGLLLYPKRPSGPSPPRNIIALGWLYS